MKLAALACTVGPIARVNRCLRDDHCNSKTSGRGRVKVEGRVEGSGGGGVGGCGGGGWGVIRIARSVID